MFRQKKIQKVIVCIDIGFITFLLCYCQKYGVKCGVFLLFSYSIGTSTSVLAKHMLHVHGKQITTEREDTKQKKLTDVFIMEGGKKTHSINQAIKIQMRNSFWVGGWRCGYAKIWCRSKQSKTKDSKTYGNPFMLV